MACTPLIRCLINLFLNIPTMIGSNLLSCGRENGIIKPFSSTCMASIILLGSFINKASSLSASDNKALSVILYLPSTSFMPMSSDRLSHAFLTCSSCNPLSLSLICLPVRSPYSFLSFILSIITLLACVGHDTFSPLGSCAVSIWSRHLDVLRVILLSLETLSSTKLLFSSNILTGFLLSVLIPLSYTNSCTWLDFIHLLTSSSWVPLTIFGINGAREYLT